MHKILLVDDDEATIFVHKIIIETSRPDVIVDKCYDSLEGINKLKYNFEYNIKQPDVIFLDLNMPVMDWVGIYGSV